MTVLLKIPYGAFGVGASVNLDNATEAAMVAQGIATYVTNPGSTFLPLTPTEQQDLRDGATGTAIYATLALTATASGQRQALGSTRVIRFTAPAAGSIYMRFVDASAAIGVSSSDTVVDCNASTPVTLSVPSSSPFVEYLRVGGSNVSFNLGLMV